MLADLRYALRLLAKSPGFAITAVLTLALGIGANIAIYSIIHGALTLPYPHSERMIAIQNVFPTGSYYAASWPDFEEWRAKSTSFSGLVASTSRGMTWNGAAFGHSVPESVNTGLVSEGFFSLFGIKPVLGRDFLPAQHQQGAAPVCMVDEKFWRQQLHADSGVVGRGLDLDGKSCTIVGVMPLMLPAGYRPTEVWIPLEINKPWDKPGVNYLFVRGRLRSGVTQQQAQAELSTVQSQIDKQFPDNKHAVAIHPLSQAFFGDLRPIMQALLVAVGFILLVACFNLANILLARASDRTREFALRRALGASSRRLIRQALGESLLLAAGGVVAGLLAAFGLTHIPLAAWPKGFVPPSAVHLDGAILGFACVLGIVTGLLFGIVPALRIVRQDDRSALQPGRAITESRRHGRTRGALVISEIALSMLLVVGALNVAMYFVSLLRVDPGVDPRNALVMSVQLPPLDYPKAEDQRRFYHALMPRLSALPSVTAVGGSVDTPFTGWYSNGDFEYEGQPAGSTGTKPVAEKHYITMGFFAAIGASLRQGREFSPGDNADAPPVAIINRTMAQKLWPGESAIGKRLKPGNDWVTIVGVVRDIEFAGPGEPPANQIFIPIDQVSVPFLTFIVRTSPGSTADPLSLTEPARAAVASIDSRLAVSNVSSFEALAHDALAGQRTSTTVTSVLGMLALLLASVGVYGIMAYSVARREREFGIRVALGANRGSIARLLYGAVSRLLLAGMALGITLAFAARVWMAKLLGPQGTSVSSIALGALLLSTVAVIAAAVPARRATSVQPIEALRNE